MSSLRMLWIGFAMVVTASAARAEGSKPFPFKVLVRASAHYPITNNPADRDGSVTYQKYFTSGLETSAHVGTVWEGVYLGGIYEYWLSSRKGLISGTEYSDVLAYHSVGGEVGYFAAANPRIYWMITAAILYPMQQQVTSTGNGDSTPYYGQKLLSYQVRGALGFKMYNRVSLFLEGGYRWANLRNLTSPAGTSYVTGGQNFDLSGPFVGAGLALHL